jgi:replication initiation protein RepC
MAESTLRRHLAALVRAGVIKRNDSPNGKRFALKGADGAREAAYGFDLRPLLIEAPEIARQAAERREIEAQSKRKRIEASVILRDVAKLAEYALDQGQKVTDVFLGRLADARKALRRKLAFSELTETLVLAQQLLSEINAIIISKTKDMSGNDIQDERHLHNSSTKTIDYEPSLEQERVAESRPSNNDLERVETSNIPFALVAKACPDLGTFSQRDLRDWSDLIHAADIVRPMLGISPHAWSEAINAMGAQNAAITLGYILQRAADIQNPGGYLRSLTRKAQDRAFSSGPLVMALLTPQGQG